MGKSFIPTDSPSHQGETNVWLTPRWLLDQLGEFDLDPASCRGWNTAKNHYYEDGLEKEWNGRIWLNPPYGKNIYEWLNKLEAHGNGIALVFARTDTKWFQNLKFDAVNFIRGRIKFLREDLSEGTNAGTPSCLIAFGKENVEAIMKVPGLTLLK